MALDGVIFDVDGTLIDTTSWLGLIPAPAAPVRRTAARAGGLTRPTPLTRSHQ
jgi:phosphoglycolate phosphatase-like HAD superfamily hydrolase